MVQMFDVRAPKTSLLQLQAHQGPVYCLEWHPEERGVLATGGRDRVIKTWELEAVALGGEQQAQPAAGVAAAVAVAVAVALVVALAVAGRTAALGEETAVAVVV